MLILFEFLICNMINLDWSTVLFFVYLIADGVSFKISKPKLCHISKVLENMFKESDNFYLFKRTEVHDRQNS